MRTRSNFYPSNSTAYIPRRSNRRRIPNIVELEFRIIAKIVLMADRTMEELLQEPTEGYGEAIVIPEILAEKFEIKTNLLQLVQANKFHVEIFNKQVIAPAKAVEKTCVTCGGAHAYYECVAIDSNPSSVCAATGSYNQVSPPNRASHQIPPPGFAPVQNNINRFNQAKVPLNENCSAMLLKKLPEKLRDPGKFLIHCDFLRMEVCHALADLGASINLMPLSIWKKLSLPELTPTRMTLELADRSITRPQGVDEDVFVKVGKFHFPTDFVVADFKADPRVSLILGRSFLRIGRALINVYGEEITLRVNNESITFNLDQVMKYSDNSDSILKTSPFGESYFFSEEIENFLKDDSIPMEIENFMFDPEGDILLIEKLLNKDPCQLPPMNFNQAKSPMEEPECSLSMGYEHFITTLVTELDEVAESSAKNLVPIPSEYEVFLDDNSEYNEPIKNDSFLAFTTFTNPLFNNKDDFTIHDEDVPIEESKDYSNPLFDNDEIYSDELESYCLNVESNFVKSLSNHDTLKFDHLEEFSRPLMPILQDNDSQREEIDIVSNMDELLPPGFENDDLEEEIVVLEELRIDNSIPNSKNKLSGNEASDFDNPSFLRPPPEPPDDKFDFEPNSGEVILALMNNNDELNEDNCFDPGGEIDVFTNVEDDDYFPFMFVSRIFLPYLIYPEVFLLLLSAESEDTIFDPGISV
nr:reverse transcriptase domain-containing protein [Tanacetum cinerariifolium]